MQTQSIYFVVSNLGIGGTQRITLTLSEWMSSNDFKVKIIAVGRFANQYELPQNIPFCCLEHKSNANLLKTVLKLRKIIKNESPDVVITMGVATSLFSTPALIGLKTKHIISERNDPRHFLGKPIVAIISHMLMNFADGFVFQTEDAQSYYNKLIRKKSEIIPNPIMAQNIPDASGCNIKHRIVTMGRLIEQKNHKLLIDAFDIFYMTHPEYKLEIYGSGILKDKLTNYIATKQSSSNVIMHEACNDVLEKISDAEIFVLSSDFEGMPNALMEAMATGLACISTDCPCGGPKYLIRDGINGILVPTNNSKLLADKMTILADNENVRVQIATEARKINYDLNTDKICMRWCEFCLKICS